MSKKSPNPVARDHARALRQQQTVSEGLLWGLLRRRQLCGLKFRRQHPIGPWIADFACVEFSLVVEIDGDYHDEMIDKDLHRNRDLKQRGWKVIRFSCDEVEQDALGVCLAITRQIGVDFHLDCRGVTNTLRRGKPK